MNIDFFPKEMSDYFNDYTKVVYVIYGTEVNTARGKLIRLDRCISQRNLAVGFDKEENTLYVRQWIK